MGTTRRQFLAFAGGATVGFAAAPALLRFWTSRVDAQAIPGAPTFRGDATTSAVGPVSLNTGVTVVRAQFTGTTNFGAALIQPQPGAGPAGPPVTGGFYGLFNQIGAFKGAAATLVNTPGNYYLQVSASGAFQLSVEQPLPETVTPVAQASFSGKGQDVSPYFTLPSGVSQISCQSSARSLVVVLYHLDDLGGESIAAGQQYTVPEGYGVAIFDFRDATNQPRYPIALPDTGPYLLYAANVPANDPMNQNVWTISFS